MTNLKKKAMARLAELVSRYPELAAQRGEMVRAASLICACHRRKKKVLICGNGGSASDSQHIAGELMKSFAIPRPIPALDIKRLRRTGAEDWEFFATHLQQGIATICLVGNSAINTAIANDTAPELVFAQQVYVLGQPGDVLIGMSTSGKSRNVIQALKTARALSLGTIGFSGCAPAPMDEYCDVSLKATEHETFKVQEQHLPLYHTLCLMVEEELFGK